MIDEVYDYMILWLCWGCMVRGCMGVDEASAWVMKNMICINYTRVEG